MARPPKQPDRADIPAEEHEAYDAVIARLHAMFGPDEHQPAEAAYFRALLNSPSMSALAGQLGTFVRTAGNRENTYSHADREFIGQVFCADWKSNVGQGVHIPDAVAAGVRIEAIEALRHGREDELTDDEQLLARYIRDVVSGSVDDDTYERIERRLGTRGLIEYAGAILWLHWGMRMLQLLRQHNPSDAEVERMIADLRSGAMAIPHLAARLA